MRDTIIGQAQLLRHEAEVMIHRGTYDSTVCERAIRLHRMVEQGTWDEGLLSDLLDRFIRIAAGCWSIGFLTQEHSRMLTVARAMRDELLMDKVACG